MKNRLVCLEGTLDFEEQISIQSINIVSFQQGQQITINRDQLQPGRTLVEHMSQQLNTAEKIFNQFSFVKMEELNGPDVFTETVLVVFTFVTGPGQKVWQVTYATRITDEIIMNFTSVYPDEAAMKNEIGRLQHCIRSFKLGERK